MQSGVDESTLRTLNYPVAHLERAGTAGGSLAAVRGNVFPVQLNQARLVFPRRLEFRPELGDTIKILSEQRRNFFVVNSHQSAHRALNILQECHLPGTFISWHELASIAALV